MTSFDHHAELESYNDSMRERDETCEFCGSKDPAESATHCLRCAHVILETEMRPDSPTHSNGVGTPGEIKTGHAVGNEFPNRETD